MKNNIDRPETNMEKEIDAVGISVLKQMSKVFVGAIKNIFRPKK